MPRYGPDETVNARVAETCDRLGCHWESSTPVAPATLSRLHFGVKKLLFLCTDSADHAEALATHDLSTFMVIMPHQTGNLEDMTKPINNYANYCMALYEPRLKEQFGTSWIVLDQTQRFWAVYRRQFRY